MKLVNFFMSSLITCALVSCSSNKLSSEKAQAPQGAPFVQRKYVVTDRSHEEAPLWSYDFFQFNEGQAQSSDRFFIGDSGDVNDRIAGCESAKARSRQEIALEMGTFISSKMAETAEGQAVINKMESSSNGGIKRDFASMLKQEAMALLPGVQVVSSTWEERDYSKAGGTNSVFNCKTLVKINKKVLEDVIKKTTKKVLDQAPSAANSNLLESITADSKEFTYALKEKN